jgi:hypothetical protein
LKMPSNFLLYVFRKKKAETETQQDIQENIFIFSQLFRSVYHTCNAPLVSWTCWGERIVDEGGVNRS